MDILDDDLSDAEFVAMIEAADIVVLPYHAEAFRRRTSGILIDSILLGKPVVVLEGTWLADMVAATRTGEIAAATSEGIVAAVRRIMLDHAAYAPGIARAAADYVAHEGWASLVARVLSVAGARVPQRPADPAKAVEDRRRHVLRTLVSSVPTRAPIYLPTEKVPLADQVAGMARVKRIYDATLDAVHRPRLRALRETWRGTKRCFVIGNGPSLNRTDLSKLEGEVTFAVNGFFLKMPELGWHPTFYVVEDHLVAEDRAPWINRLKGPTKLFPAYLGYAFPEADDTIFFNHRPRKSYPHGFDFSLDAAEVTYTGCTVTFTVLQLAAYLGFEEIYLVGVDADYAIPPDAQQASAYSTGVIDMQSDDTNHFHPDYFGKGFRWHDPQVDKMVEAYAEARRTIETTDQRIYNATVGGKLEVFERRDFESLFPKPPAPALPRPAAAYPRLLVLDMTVPGRGTATGEIKSSLMADWPTDRVLQIAARPDPAVFMKAERAPDGGWAVSQLDDAAAAAAAARRFAPDAILYRPLPDVPHLHGLAMEILTGGMTPFAIWVMDDWLARLAAEEPARHPAMKADMERLAADATVRLAISDAMARALEAEYAVAFATLANGVDPADWTRPHRHRPGPMLVRYAGGLEETMTRASVLRIARAVEALARSDVPVRFEITTRIKVPEIIDAFRPFRHTRVEYASRPSAEYFAWLAGADVTLIAYNFDPVSTTYVRHSMANKMPECLASGSVLLAHGPEGLATLDYLAAHEAAVVVTRDSDAAVTEALRRLQADPARRAQIAARGRLLAFARHDLRAQRETFRLYMTEVARGAGTSAAPAAAAERDAALRELAQLRAHFEALHAAATAQAMQDGPGAGSDTRAMAARIEALEAENERLYAALQQALRQARWAPRRDGTAG
jgi:glycosyltransferase involved in cell wall biosynthesis